MNTLRLSPQRTHGKEIVVYTKLDKHSTTGEGGNAHEFRQRRRAFHKGIEQPLDLLVVALALISQDKPVRIDA